MTPARTRRTRVAASLATRTPAAQGCVTESGHASEKTSDVTSDATSDATRDLIRVRTPRGINHTRPMQQRYDAVVDVMLAKYELNVRRWRTSLSGVAIQRTFRDGRSERWLESPYPSSPLRMAIFLHEVGHHAIGLGVHRPRCREELLAWEWSLRHMKALGFVTGGVVARRVVRSMRYEVSKALRGRGRTASLERVRTLPRELIPFVPAHLVSSASAATAAT